VVNGAECEGNSSPPSGAKVKNECSSTSIPPHGMDREHFTLHIVLIVFLTWIHRLPC